MKKNGIKLLQKNNVAKTIYSKKIDDNMIKYTYDWEYIYDKLESGSYTFTISTKNNQMSISINFNIDTNGQITYDKPMIIYMPLLNIGKNTNNTSKLLI